MQTIFRFFNSFFEILEEKRIILFIVDGLGIEGLRLRKFKKNVYKTVFPSSTSTFFYSLHSLLPPKDHGFLEWYMRFKNTIITIPPWKTIDGKFLELGKDVNKRDVFPFKSLSEILYKKGFTSIYYTPYSDSIFTKLTSRKSEVIKIDFLSQVFPLREADFTFIYWPSIDVILHERFRDEAFSIEKKMIEFFVEILKKKLPKHSVLFVLGDHGLVKCEKRFLLPPIDDVYPVGGGRVAFYKELEKETVEKLVKKKKIPAAVLELNELEDFQGKINKRCYENFGEIVVIAKRSFGFKYPFEIRKNKKKWDIGSHGGLTREENQINIWTYEK